MVTVRFRALATLLIAVAAVLLSACGNATDQPGSGTGGGSSAPAPTTTPTTTPTTPPTSAKPPGSGGTVAPGPTGIPVDRPRPVTIDGVIEAGVEPGCKVLTAGSARYLILGGNDAPMGVPVRVEGTLQPGVLSTCQQGTPLRVSSVKRR
jgi:hypothetical protein